MTMYGSQTILESSQAPPPNNCLRSVHCHYRSLYLIYYINPGTIKYIIFWILGRLQKCKREYEYTPKNVFDETLKQEQRKNNTLCPGKWWQVF
jgi:hypothetical protein